MERAARSAGATDFSSQAIPLKFQATNDLTGRIRKASTILTLLKITEAERTRFNATHWTAFFNCLSDYPRGQLLKPHQLQIWDYADEIKRLSFTTEQIVQIVHRVNKHRLGSSRLIANLIEQSARQVYSFTDQALSLLLQELPSCATEGQMSRLLTAVVGRFSNEAACESLSPGALVILIRTLASQKAYNGYLHQCLLPVTTHRLTEFRKAEMGELVAGLFPIVTHEQTATLLQASEKFILNFKEVSSRDWSTYMRVFSLAKLHAPQLAKMAMKAHALNGDTWTISDKLGVLRGMALMGIFNREAATLATEVTQNPQFNQIPLGDQCNLLRAHVFLLGEARKKEAHPLIAHLLRKAWDFPFRQRNLLQQAITLTDYQSNWFAFCSQRTRCSPVQTSVAEAIQQAFPNTTVTLEAPCGYSYVDILLTLRHGERPIAIEVNGAHHYAFNDKHPTGRTLLKERMIEKMGWYLITIKVDNWKAETDDFVKWLNTNPHITSPAERYINTKVGGPQLGKLPLQ